MSGKRSKQNRKIDSEKNILVLDWGYFMYKSNEGAGGFWEEKDTSYLNEDFWAHRYMKKGLYGRACEEIHTDSQELGLLYEYLKDAKAERMYSRCYTPVVAMDIQKYCGKHSKCNLVYVGCHPDYDGDEVCNLLQHNWVGWIAQEGLLKSLSYIGPELNDYQKSSGIEALDFKYFSSVSALQTLGIKKWDMICVSKNFINTPPHLDSEYVDLVYALTHCISNVNRQVIEIESIEENRFERIKNLIKDIYYTYPFLPADHLSHDADDNPIDHSNVVMDDKTMKIRISMLNDERRYLVEKYIPSDLLARMDALGPNEVISQPDQQ